MLASSEGISCWTSLKPQHSNPNTNPLANQLWCIGFLTPPTSLITTHRLPGFLESLMPYKNWCSIHARWSKSSLKHSMRFCGIFPSLNFIAYRSSKVPSRPDCIFEIHQLWESGFSRVYYSCCCSCWFEAEIIKIGQSSHKMYNNNIVTILNACTKMSGNLLNAPHRCLKLQTCLAQSRLEHPIRTHLIILYWKPKLKLFESNVNSWNYAYKSYLY